MNRKFLFPLLCLPLLEFALLSHCYPAEALGGFIGLSLFQAVLGLFFYAKKETSAVVFLIFLEGLALKLFYIVQTPYDLYQHDVGKFSDAYEGHYGYIWWILKNHTIPAFEQIPHYPFSHPPLHYILSALFLSVFPNYEHLQYMTLFWSFGSSVVSYLCLRLFLKKEEYRILSALFCSFFPAFIFYSGSLNNDILTTFLTLLSVFCFLLHLKKNRTGLLILSAVFLGLTGLVKLNGIPAYAGVVLFYVSASIMRQMGWKKAIKEFLIFSVFCVPILVWWPVYNYLKWDGFSVFSASIWWPMGKWSDMFSGYHLFPYLADTSVDKYQYVGAYSLFDRLGPVLAPVTRPFQWSGEVYPGMVPDYNIWIGLLKTALFDEWDLFCMGFGISWESTTLHQTLGLDLAIILLILSYILFLFFVWAFFKVSRKNKMILYCQSMIVMVMLGFIAHCFKNPARCAVLFRYVAFLVPCLSLFILQYVQENLAQSTAVNQRIKTGIGMTVFLFSGIAAAVWILALTR